ncbi:hypothetical protein [Arthrobacter sp. UYEF3]|uniref:sunset domain-containing protein n=1 Tax=Arthrobacter sp. UYEF3 TaxID=1756365 RepID=UPI00339103BF
MDWIIWLIVIVVIVGIVWWLLNRNNSRGGAGTSTSTGSGSDAAPLASASREKHDGALSGGNAAASAVAAATTGIPSAAGFGNAEPVPPTTAEERAADDAVAAAPDIAHPGSVPGGSSAVENTPQSGPEWETQWSETPPVEPQATTHHDVPRGAHAAHPADGGQSAGMEATVGTATAPADAAPLPDMEAPASETLPASAAEPAHPSAEHAPLHHPEYTAPHAPTLPGAESAAAEAAEPETAQSASSVAASEGIASHTAAPAGHLAVEQPYGEGSAAPATDGSGPEGFSVKGEASSMIYHDETSPSYEDTRAEVWFLSPAHAEAAGFRPPRRSRL